MNWIDFVSSQTQLINPLALVRENINKKYIENIAQKGLSVIPTIYLERHQKASITSIMKEQGWADIIVKPAIGLSSFGVERVNDSTISTTEEQKHLDNLLQNGDVLVQPYFSAVEDYGERNLIFIAGEFSHCVRKMRFQALAKAGEVSDTLVEADTDELALAKKIIENISPLPLYARVDLLRDLKDHPCLIELELIDPKLFFALYSPAIENFIENIIRLL
jgi:glutathione synthase/RimK-type ligase-like ATP-grasp enzyme